MRRTHRRRYSVLATVMLVGALGLFFQASAQTIKVAVSHRDAAAVLQALPDSVPSDLQGVDLEEAWPIWASRWRLRQRERLDRGDEDSLVNLWLYGTSFTRYPPFRTRDQERGDDETSASDVLRARLDDLVAGIVKPGANERLQFARAVLDSRGIDPATGDDRARARRFLMSARARAIAEFERTDNVLRSALGAGDPGAWWAARSSIFRDRGLSSDTSILVNFALDQALEALAANGTLQTRAIRNIAIVGPGLDFINKADGHDFYPEQSIQPFALIDSLLRLGLTGEDPVRVATFDVSVRVNAHLARARRRAEAGNGYVLHALLSADERWTAALRAYWRQFGDRIGMQVRPTRAPADSRVQARAIRIRPEIVSAIVPDDLDVVVERLEIADPARRFDLVVATNVFVYYTPFEQGLALANIATMLRPGGIVLSNDYVRPTASFAPSIAPSRVIYSDRQDDVIFAYRRR